MSRVETDLAEFCKRRAGETLRAVFTYTAGGGDVVYAREDVRGAYRGGFEQFRTAAWRVHRTVVDEEPKVETLGDYRVTVHTFERAFVMQFFEGADRGVAVVFDRDIGRDLHEFLLECESFLQERSGA